MPDEPKMCPTAYSQLPEWRKEQMREASKRWRKSHPDQFRAIKRKQEGRRRCRHKDALNAYRSKWLARHPARAHVPCKVYRAIRSGKLTKGPCEECGRANAVAHHDDYSKPLEVRWLCQSCHQLLHKVEREAV